MSQSKMEKQWAEWNKHSPEARSMVINALEDLSCKALGDWNYDFSNALNTLISMAKEYNKSGNE